MELLNKFFSHNRKCPARVQWNIRVGVWRKDIFPSPNEALNIKFFVPTKCLQPHYHMQTFNFVHINGGIFAFSRFCRRPARAQHTQSIENFFVCDWCEKRALWTEWNDESDIIFTPFHSRHVYPVLLLKFFNPERVFHSTGKNICERVRIAVKRAAPCLTYAHNSLLKYKFSLSKYLN